MIIHLVLLKQRPDLTEDERSAFARSFEHAIREIPGVRGVRLGKRVTHGVGYEASAPDAADVLAIIEFDDLDGLRSYLQHPAHQELGALFGRSLAGSMVYDFEMGDLEYVAAQN